MSLRTARRAIACSIFIAAMCIINVKPVSAAQFKVTGFTKFGNDVSFLGFYETSTTDAAGVHREIISDFVPPTPYFPDYHVESSATAGIAGLGSHTYGVISHDITQNGGGGQPVDASSIATGIFEDIVIDGPAGSVMTSFNMLLEGFLSVAAEPAILGYSYARSIAQVSFYVNGEYVGGGTEKHELTFEGDVVVPSVNKNGVFTLWDSYGSITSPSFMVPTNVPFTLEVQLQTSIRASGYTNVPFNASAASDFGHTLNFVKNASVFNLEDGYSANSADAGIINNAFAIPEISTLALSCWAPLLIAVLYRRRRVV